MDARREAAVAEARGWISTPYHHQGRIKGAGTDCAMLLAAVYYAADVIPFIDPRPYPADWHLHRPEQRYLGFVRQYCHQVERPGPGDVVLYQFGRCLAHGGIVTAWPMIIHAYQDARMVIEDRGDLGRFTDRYHEFWSPFHGD